MSFLNQNGLSFSNASLNRGITPFNTLYGDTSLTAYWKFNEASGDIINQSQSASDLGSGADFQITGATYIPSGDTSPFGYAMLFDGVDDFGKAGTSLSQFSFLYSTTSTFTIAFWLKIVPQAGERYVFDNSNNFAGSFIRIGDDESGGFAVKNSSSQTVIPGDVSANFFPDTNWHFYVWTNDQSLGSNNTKVKRDDANLEQFTKTGNTPTNGNSGTALYVGARNATSLPANMYICEVSIWSKVLTDADQTSLYNAGAGLEIY